MPIYVASIKHLMTTSPTGAFETVFCVMKLKSCEAESKGSR